MRQLIPLFALASLASCSTLHSPAVETSVSYSSQYWFRGAVQNDSGVLQGDLSVSMQTAGEGTVGLTTWGNMDTSNDTGDAPFPDGNGGVLTEIDLIGWYSRRIGNVDYEIGLINYSFPSGVGGSTNEAYVGASWEVAGLDMGLTVFYDFDALDDYYANFGVGHSFELDNDLRLDTGVSVGAMGEGQAEVYFGTKDAGLADLNANATLNYQIDEHCSTFLGVHSTSVLSSDFEDAVKTAGYTDSDIWLSLGLAWSY